MRKLLLSVTLASLMAAPLQAADWQNQAAGVRPGAFVGARVQLSLGGKASARPRAALTIAPTQSRISTDGMVRTNIGEGLALNLTPGAKPSLTLGGRRADVVLGLKRSESVDAENKLGVSTGAWVAIGVLTTVVVGGVVFYSVVTDCDDHDDECG